MSTFRPIKTFLAGALALAAVSGCSLSTEGELSTYAGEWCLLRGLGSGGLPRVADPHISMTLFQESNVVSGSGSTKWPGSDVIYMSRFQGTIEGDKAVLQVFDLDSELTEGPGPVFMLELRIEGTRDLSGAASGDAAFAGTYSFVRLGPRCFFE